MGNRVNPYIMALFIYSLALFCLVFPILSKASEYEVNGIWDHPTKKGKWIVEVEYKSRVIKFEIDDLSNKNDKDKKEIISWMAKKAVENLEGK